MLLQVSKGLSSKRGQLLPTEDCFRYEDTGQLTNWQIVEPFATTTIQKDISVMLALKNESKFDFDVFFSLLHTYLVLMNNDQILCTQIYVFVLNHKRMFHAYLIPFDAKARRNLEIMQLYNLVKHDLTLKKNCFTLQSSLSYHFKVSLIRDLAAATCC